MADQSGIVTKQISSSQHVSTSATSASSTTTAVKTSYQSSSFKSSSQKMVAGSGTTVGQSATLEQEMEKMKSTLDAQMTQMKINALQLLPIGPSQVPTDLIKLDHQSIQQYVDEKHKDTVKFNFDVTQFQSESVIVKSDGNKIEVHAKKQVKKGDDETTEEYSRVYELPSGCDVHRVTSSLNKDGKTFTVELPITEK